MDTVVRVININGQDVVVGAQKQANGKWLAGKLRIEFDGEFVQRSTSADDAIAVWLENVSTGCNPMEVYTEMFLQEVKMDNAMD